MSDRIVSTGALVSDGEERKIMRAKWLAEHGGWTWCLALNGSYAGHPLTFKTSDLKDVANASA